MPAPVWGASISSLDAGSRVEITTSGSIYSAGGLFAEGVGASVSLSAGTGMTLLEGGTIAVRDADGRIELRSQDYLHVNSGSAITSGARFDYDGETSVPVLTGANASLVIDTQGELRLSGSVTEGTLTVRVVAPGTLAAGVHDATVVLTSPVATSVEVPVRLTVAEAPPPTVVVTPGVIVFQMDEGASGVLTQEITVSSDGAGEFSASVGVTGLNDAGVVAGSVANGAHSLINSSIGTRNQRMGIAPMLADGDVGLGPWIRIFADQGDVAPRASGFGADRGFGVELSTQASGAIRAGSGLLLTTEPGSQQLAAAQTLGQLSEGEQLLQALADTAKSQEAILPGDPDTLPAQQSLQQLQQILQTTRQGQGAAGGEGAKIGGGEGEASAWSSPQLVASSPEGLMSLTPADQAWVSGTQTSLVAGSDLDWASQGETVIASGGGIALFTQGSDAPAGKPNQEAGISLHAAQGKVSARAHRNVVKVAAKQSVTIASTQADVEIAAPNKHVLLTAQGAYLKLEGGDIELGAPGTIEFKASHRELAAPGTASSGAPAFGEAEPKFCDYAARQAEADGAATVPMG